MKTNLLLFYVFILGLISTKSTAQNSTNLTPVDEFTYEARTSKVVYTESAEIPEFEENSNLKMNTSSGIGETQGTLAVSLTGAATYSVPIAAPPGVGSVQPNISIGYNSQSGNGIAGWGWNLSGISSITRIPSTKYHDGVIDPVDLDKLDRFSLDGQRLILKSGSYGGDGTQYETEEYSNLKITSYGVSPYGSSYGPAYFKVEYPDGSKGFYGNLNNSRSRLEYALAYVDNSQGLRINYKYTTSNNVLRLIEISYGARGFSTGMNRISFSYKSRAFKPTSYVNGIAFKSSYVIDEINVTGNGVGYRNYKFTYNTSKLGYDRLTSIQEFSGDKSLAHTPIIFDYQNTTDSQSYTQITANLGLVDIAESSAETIPLDLTGNGKMDFIVSPKTKDRFYIFKGERYHSPYIVNTGKYEEIIPTTSLNHQNKILEGQGVTVIQHTSDNKAKFKVYANYDAPALLYQYEKTWTPPTYITDVDCRNYDSTEIVPQRYLSGDFNGDGLTDIMAVARQYSSLNCYLLGSCRCQPVSTSNTSRVNFINLDRRATSGFVFDIGKLKQVLGPNDKIQTADVNGDGRTDFLHFTEGKVFAYTLNRYNSLQLMWETSSSYLKNSLPVLIGDYNGDGKMDFMTPSTNGSKNFRVFSSTGISFVNKTQSLAFTYNVGTWDGTTLRGYKYIPVDINNDGKTDIIRYTTKTYNNSSNGYQQVSIYHNVNPSNSTDDFAFRLGPSKSRTGDLKHRPIPTFLSSSNPNYGLEFATISDNNIHSFGASNDHNVDTRVQNINNNGVDYKINYSRLDPTDTSNGIIYESVSNQVYPYVSIHTSPNISIVRSLERRSLNTPTLKQQFHYRNAVSHLEGIGFIGFEHFSRSNWHSGGGDRIYDNSTRDISLRGSIINEYQTPFTERFGVIPSDYIHKTRTNYEFSIAANKVFKVIKTSVVRENRIDGTVTTNHFSYDSFNNPTKITTNYSGHGSNTTYFTYTNSSSPYFRGRLINQKTTSTVSGNSFSTEEQYTYNGFLVSHIKSKGNGTQFDSTFLTYDQFGNVTRSESIPYGASSGRVTTYEYDPSGRYLVKSKDILGLETSYAYDTSNGNLLSETNPYNQTVNFEYDKWNRLIKTVDYLGNADVMDYSETNHHYTVTSSGADGSSASTTYDPLKRVISERTKSMNGQWSQVTMEYDQFDRVIRASEPHFGSSPSQWNTTSYDYYGRITNQTLYTGKSINYTYNGLSVTVDDGTKVVTTTKDAMGNIVRVDDPGGTIRYTHFGNGNVKTVSYEGTTQIIEQDGWGRKTKLIDPSAGTYTYEYNGFGEITKETTPKGTTTYQYESDGRLRQSKIVGSYTNMTTTYGYDYNTKLLINITASDQYNNKSSRYEYTYDSYKRPYKVFEYNGNAFFSKTYSYDGFSRISAESYTAKLGSKTSSSGFTHYYNANGAFTGIDNWRINSSNARGQITQISLGTRHTEDRNYDTYGYLLRQKVANYDSRELIVGNDYKFNPQRGTLNERWHGTKIGDDWVEYNETFSYDNLDRLTNISGPFAKQKRYDNLGRITFNSKIGSFAYESGSKKFQLKEIATNSAGEQFFTNRTRQQVTYNAFKKPVKIFEDGGRGIVSFEYGAFGNRTEAWYGDSEPDKNNRRFHKRYSSIIPAEILEDKQENSIKFVFYNGGDAYSAPIAKIEKINASGNSDGGSIYHLQRDYLGSILNIIKKVGAGNTARGVLVEKRQFGAWGTVDAYWSANGGSMGHQSLLDRGYTGHEHFDEVGLIHMNGRMYDPNLGRFLSPDNFVQNPYNTQNFNRYGYVLNNPLMYNDPSGEYAEGILAGGVAIYYAAAGAIMVGSALAAKWDDWGIKDWSQKFFSNWGTDGSRPFREIGRWFRREVLGEDTEPKIMEMSQNYVNTDPLIAPNQGISAELTSNGGSFMNFAHRGIISYQAGQIGRLIAMKDGITNIIQNPSSLFTWDTYLGAVSAGLDFFPIIAAQRTTGRLNRAAATGDIGAFGYALGGESVDFALTVTSAIPGVGMGGKVASTTGRVASGIGKSALSNLQLVRQVATRAERAIGGTGRFAGTAKHVYASNLLRRYQRLYGDRGLRINEYFNNNNIFGSGNRGFLDVRDLNNNVIYDFKFGKSGWSIGQFEKYSRNFPNYILEIIRP